MSIIRRISGFGAVLLVLQVASADERLAVNLNTYSRVEINRSAAAIWPYILHPNQWKPERQLIHRSGPVDQVGEVFAVMGGDKVWFLTENVELVLNERRTIKMYDTEGRLLGFAVWRLESLGPNRTVVTYDVHGESVFPPDQEKKLTPEAVQSQQHQGYDSNKKRIDAELEGLKRILESK